MKVVIVGVVFAAALIGVVLYEEGRIAKLEEELASLKNQPAEPVSPGGSVSGSPALAAGGGREGKSGRVKTSANGGKPAGTTGEDDANWAETFRKMMENPVGAAVIKEEYKGKAMLIYGDFIESLNLKKEEKDYFLSLVSAGVGEEDTVGMKMLGAKSDEERVKILDQMEADQKARREAVKEFLNDDEDFARYEHFEARKEIYEQMPGLHAAMKDAGAPMDAGQEEKLVEAIYQASEKSGLNNDWTGREGMIQFAQPGATQRFKDQWAETQTLMKNDVEGILPNPEQRRAFAEHQTQVENMVTFGLQFVEKMIADQQGGGGNQ